MNENQTQTFAAVAYDQFGNAMVAQPSFTWNSTGIGSIDATTGVFTSPGFAGAAVISATSGNITGSATVHVTNAAPTVADPASAGADPVTGTTTTLSVLGADDGGEANLTYTWTAIDLPTGASAIFSANGSNAAKNSTVTFDEAGDYALLVTINDGQGGTVTSSVSILVDQTLTQIEFSPNARKTVLTSQTLPLTIEQFDQFGKPMSQPAPVTWSIVSGSGLIDAAGIYTAPDQSGAATARADVGSLTASLPITILPSPVTVPVPQSPSPQQPESSTTNNSSILQDNGGGSNPTPPPGNGPSSNDVTPDTSGNSDLFVPDNSPANSGDDSGNDNGVAAALNNPPPKPVASTHAHVSPHAPKLPPTSRPSLLAAAPDDFAQSGPVVIAPINRSELMRASEIDEAALSDDATATEQRLKLRVGFASVMGVGAAGAYLIWIVRGAGVLASFLANTPVWKLVDPMFVLPQARNLLRAARKPRPGKKWDGPEDQIFGGPR
jgi:hypothetical protein